MAFVGPVLSTCYVFWAIGQWLSSETSWSKGMTTLLTVAVIVHGYSAVFLYGRVAMMSFLLRSWGVGLLAAVGFTLWYRFEDWRLDRSRR